MHSKLQNNIWQNLSAGLIGVILTLFITWLSYGKEVVTRSEVENIMLNYSPYVRAESGLQERLRYLEKGIEEINVKLDRILEMRQ